MESEGVGRMIHLDVFIVVVVNIGGMTTQNQQHNVVIVINVYAKTQKHVSTVLPVHIKTKQDLLRVKPVRLGRTIPNKDKLLNLVAKHVNKDINVQAGTSKNVLPVHIKTKQVLPHVKPVRLGRTIPNKDKLVVLHAIQARFPQLDSLIAQRVHQMHILLIKKNA